MPEIKPFSPAEARGNKKKVLPEYLIRAINLLLSERYTKGSFNIKAKDIILKAQQLRYADSEYSAPPNGSDEYYDKGWMDFESIYEDEGWSVKYTKPDYTESFDSYYTFKELK